MTRCARQSKRIDGFFVRAQVQPCSCTWFGLVERIKHDPNVFVVIEANNTTQHFINPWQTIAIDFRHHHHGKYTSYYCHQQQDQTHMASCVIIIIASLCTTLRFQKVFVTTSITTLQKASCISLANAHLAPRLAKSLDSINIVSGRSSSNFPRERL